MASNSHIVILTGAGISAESGVPTFRDADGLWEGHRVEEVASPDGFKSNPELVHRFYNLRREALSTVHPNEAHRALARLQQEHAGQVTIITQNVDDLHERSGSANVLHMHGELLKARCTFCEKVIEWQGALDSTATCVACKKTGSLRPDIVWFGEMPFYMEAISQALASATIFAAIGTSGYVYPAAGFVSLAREYGAVTLEINNTGTQTSAYFDRHLIGPATEQVPRFVEQMLLGQI